MNEILFDYACISAELLKIFTWALNQYSCEIRNDFSLTIESTYFYKDEIQYLFWVVFYKTIDRIGELWY